MIGALSGALGVELPDDYLDFLRMADGVEGPIGEKGYLALYSIDWVIECNRTYREWVPWLVFFGTSGSLSGYAFDTRTRTMPVLEADWIGMDSNPMYFCGANFVEFLENLTKDVEPIEIDPDRPSPPHT
jgi:hypothetical protein